MAAVPALRRQWLLLKMLSARRRGATQDDLAHELGVTPRTIQRDLRLLEAVGFEIEFDSKDFGKRAWKLAADTGLSGLRFTFEEAAALYLGRQFLEPIAGTLFHVGARSAFEKIRATFGEPALRHLERLAAGFYHADRGWSDYSTKAALIDDLVKAIEDGLNAAVTYRSMRSTEPVTQYDLAPLALVYWRHALYLIADSPEHGEKRTFKIDRITGVETLTVTKKKRDDFDVEAYLANSFGIFRSESKPSEVRVRFAPQARRLLEERDWHPSQRLKIGDDGFVEATFQLSAMEEFTSWIMSWGPLAEVLAPASLRNTIQTRLQETAALYDEPAKPTTPRRRIDREPSSPARPRRRSPK